MLPRSRAAPSPLFPALLSFGSPHQFGRHRARPYGSIHTVWPLSTSTSHGKKEKIPLLHATIRRILDRFANSAGRYYHHPSSTFSPDLHQSLTAGEDSPFLLVVNELSLFLFDPYPVFNVVPITLYPLMARQGIRFAHLLLPSSLFPKGIIPPHTFCYTRKFSISCSISLSIFLPFVFPYPSPFHRFALPPSRIPGTFNPTLLLRGSIVSLITKCERPDDPPSLLRISTFGRFSTQLSNLLSAERSPFFHFSLIRCPLAWPLTFQIWILTYF